MAKGKAFLVVGHKHWGNLQPLKPLTDGNSIPAHRENWVKLFFFVRRMSNDDVPDSLIELVNSLDPETTLV